MIQNTDMRLESGNCNVCSAPCSSCMHLNRALMGSKAEEFSDENCRSGEANNQYSVNEDNVSSSLGSRACESLQHAVSETSNMLSVNSSHDSPSENAESRQLLSNKYRDPKHLECHDDNTSCISRSCDTNLVNNSHQRNADRIDISYSSASVSHLEPEGSGSAPSVDTSGLEIPSYKDPDTGHSSPKVQKQYVQSLSGKSLSVNPSLMHVERDSCSRIPEKLSECSVENFSSTLTKEMTPIIISGEKSIADKDSHIDSTVKVSPNVCPKSGAENDDDVCDANGEDYKSSVHDGKHEETEELVKSPDKQEPQSENESDESDVVEHDVKVCDICGDAGREDLLAICCRCSDGAEHTYCMREMLEKVPEGDWLCEECKDAEETEKKKLDVEGKKISKVCSTSQVSGKRLLDNIELVAPPATKRQAIELSAGSPKTSSPKKLVPLSREPSFKSSDKLKPKLGHLMPIRNHSGADDAAITRSPSIVPRGQTPKSILSKSNSSNTLSSKPRVKLVDEVIPPKTKGINEHTSKNGEMPTRMTSKSTLLKSPSLGRSSSTESKVKTPLPKSATAQELKGSRQLKESGAFERKFLSRTDRPVASSVSTTKGEKLTPRGETTNPSAVNNNRELRVNQDGRKSALSKSMSNLSRRSLDPQVSAERTSPSVDEALQNVLPRSRETANQVEKTRNSYNDRVRPAVPAASKSLLCKKCKEVGHSLECCTAGTTQESGAEKSVTASSSLKEEMHKGNGLKAAIQAALRRRPEIYKKKEVPNQTDEVSTSGRELNCEVTLQDQVLVSRSPKNSISAEETREQLEILESSASDSSKCSSANDLKQLKSCPSDLCTEIGKSDFIGLTAGKSSVRDLSDKDMATSSVLSKTLAFPEYQYIWQGVFEVHRNEKPPDLCTGVQAHLSSCASPKVLEVVTKFLPKVSLSEVSRLSTWPSQFHHGGVSEDNIALYFFARDVESYERHYKGLLDHMARNDLALKGLFDGVELLIFPSNQLPENSQRWNMLFFLWGVFRGRQINHSDSAKKICIPSLNAMPVVTSSTAVLTLSELHCSPKCMDEGSINCDKACNALLPSTPTDQCQITVSRNISNPQIHGGSRLSLEKLHNGVDTGSTSRVPRSNNLLCQEMKPTVSSLEARVLEHGHCREATPPETMGTSLSSRTVETSSDFDVSVKQENVLSSTIPSVGNQERDASKDEILEEMNCDEDQQRPERKQKEDARCIDLEETIIDIQETVSASIISEDKVSERMSSDEDQQWSKSKRKDDYYIDLEATAEDQELDAPSNISKDKISENIEGEENKQGLKRKLKEDDHYIDLEATFQGDLSDTAMQASTGSCQKMHGNEVGGKLEESSSKKLKTVSGGIYSGRDSFQESFTSLGNDLGSGSSVGGDKGREEACYEKIIHEDLGTMERTFFPVDTQNISGSKLLNSMPLKGLHADRFRDGIPNLELALGGETKPPPPPPPAPKGMLPFLVGAVERKNNPADSLADEQEDAASLSLSLSFPSSNKEHKKVDGNHVNTPFLLFGRFTDK